MLVTKLYAWFERIVAAIVLVGMAIVIGLAGFDFLRAVAAELIAYDGPMPYTAFQALFDKVLAAVIALELARSILQLVAGQHGLPQLRTVVTIGMLAVVRKLIVLEIDQTSGGFLAGLAASVLALGAAYIVIDRVARHNRPFEPGDELRGGQSDGDRH